MIHMTWEVSKDIRLMYINWQILSDMRAKHFFNNKHNDKEIEESGVTELISSQLFNLDDLSKK